MELFPVVGWGSGDPLFQGGGGWVRVLVFATDIRYRYSLPIFATHNRAEPG